MQTTRELVELARRGDTLAIASTVAWFIVFGIMVGTLAFSGMSYTIVRDATLRQGGKEIARAGHAVDKASTQANLVIGPIETGRSDILSIVACEGTSGCVSGRPGLGQEVAKLDQIAKKYSTLFGQYRSGR